MAKTKMIRIQYYRSKIATPTKHKLVIKGLGFTHLNQIVEREDTDSGEVIGPEFTTRVGGN
jgi:large subunit ribosomal protein L30